MSLPWYKDTELGLMLVSIVVKMAMWVGLVALGWTRSTTWWVWVLAFIAAWGMEFFANKLLNEAEEESDYFA